MLKIRNLMMKDIAPAIELTDTMKWDLVKEDFEFMMELEPEGCFVATDDEKFIGLAITVRFESLGFIGNVIVDANYRAKGVGSSLIRHGMNYLMGKGAKTIGLYSYVDTVQFYEKLGFTMDETFLWLSGFGVKCDDIKTVEAMEDDDFERALELDRRCIGVSRERLLRSIFSRSKDLCYVTYKGNHLAGFVMARAASRTAEIGPLVCNAHEGSGAVDLLKAVLRRFIGFDIYIGVPEKKHEILSTLRELGFRENFKVIRMCYGNTPRDKSCIFSMESLERG